MADRPGPIGMGQGGFLTEMLNELTIERREEEPGAGVWHVDLGAWLSRFAVLPFPLTGCI